MSHDKAEYPEKIILQGNFVKLEPLNAEKHGNDLWEEAGKHEIIWKYLFSGPFKVKEEFLTWLDSAEHSTLRTYYTCIDQNGKALGSLSLMNVELEKKQIEIGGIFFGKNMQRTNISTETIFLLIQYAFEQLGYDRVEWRCNSLNEPSKNAAKRFGFKFQEEILKHIEVKGVIRDTTIFFISKEEWFSKIKPAFLEWLSLENFEKDGKQKRRLGDIINKSI